MGLLKVSVAKKRLERLNSNVRIICIDKRLDEEALLIEAKKASVVLDATDNFSTRLAVNRAAVQAGVPLVTGAAIRFEGQLSVFPNQGAGPCYRCLYDDEGEWLGNCQSNGVAAPVPGVVGTMMALEAMKLLLGLKSSLTNHLHLWDAKRADWKDIIVKVNPNCPDCQS